MGAPAWGYERRQDPTPQTRPQASLALLIQHLFKISETRDHGSDLI